MRALPIVLMLCLVAATAAESVSQALQRRIPRVEIVDIPVSEALDFYRDLTGLNVVVNWNAIELLGIDRDTPVTLNVANVTSRQMLTLLLRDAGQGELTYLIDDNVITITTREEASRQLVTKVYDIRDLTAPVPNFVPDFNLAGFGGGGNNGGDFGNNGEELSPDDMAELIVEVIRETIRPEIWQENGGYASIRTFQGQLIITAPADVHELIGG